MWFRRRRFYAAFRNWFWVANGLAVIGYWLYPLAPPRLTDLGLDDPTKASLELGGALSWFQPFRNEFAAMPSMHVGYTLLFALTLVWMHRGSRWRWVAFLGGGHALRRDGDREPLVAGRRRRRRLRPPRARGRRPATRSLPRPWARAT